MPSSYLKTKGWKMNNKSITVDNRRKIENKIDKNLQEENIELNQKINKKLRDLK